MNVYLKKGEERTLEREGLKEQYIGTVGKLLITCGDKSIELAENDKFDVEGDLNVTLKALSDAQVFRAMGRWRSVASSGIFRVATGTPPTNDTPYDYEKTTGFDNHYHDCDEYWIVLEGEITVVSENKFYDVGPGDNVVTGMGWHHDVVKCKGDRQCKAIYFEGTQEARKRRGHLWEPEHGKAVPQQDRV